MSIIVIDAGRSDIAAEHKVALIVAAEAGVHHMSDTRLESGRAAAGAGEAMRADILSLYALARTQAIRTGYVVSRVFALLGLVMTTGLRRILVET